jgi:hypothetical protein
VVLIASDIVGLDYFDSDENKCPVFAVKNKTFLIFASGTKRFDYGDY